MKYLTIILFLTISLIGCTQYPQAYFELKELNGIHLLYKSVLEVDDDRTYFRIEVLSNLIERISRFESFKSTELVERDFCIVSNSILIDWDLDFGTRLNSQDNFIILSVSPSGKCEDDNVLDIVIIDYGDSKSAQRECNKMYSYFERGGHRGPFSGYMTCYEEDGVLVMIEFPFEPNPEFLALFSIVSNFTKK